MVMDIVMGYGKQVLSKQASTSVRMIWIWGTECIEVLKELYFVLLYAMAFPPSPVVRLYYLPTLGTVRYMKGKIM